jgi:hypothetical protein
MVLKNNGIEDIQDFWGNERKEKRKESKQLLASNQPATTQANSQHQALLLSTSSNMKYTGILRM